MKESITSVDCTEGDQDIEEITKSNVQILHQTFISFSSLTLRKQICLYYGNYGFFSDTTAGTTKIFNILLLLRIFKVQNYGSSITNRVKNVSGSDAIRCLRWTIPVVSV